MVPLLAIRLLTTESCNPERVKSIPVELIFPTGSDIKTSIVFGPVFLAETAVGSIQSFAVALDPIFRNLLVASPSPPRRWLADSCECNAPEPWAPAADWVATLAVWLFVEEGLLV